MRVSGELDMLTAPLLETHVQRCINQRPGNVVLDLRGSLSFEAFARATLWEAAVER